MSNGILKPGDLVKFTKQGVWSSNLRHLPPGYPFLVLEVNVDPEFGDHARVLTPGGKTSEIMVIHAHYLELMERA